MKQRVAARLLLASCTLALGLGLGTATAVNGVLALRHPTLAVPTPGQAEGRLDRGRHQLSVSRRGPGGVPPLAESRPSCMVTVLGREVAAPPVAADAGFAAVWVERSGRHRVTCTSALPVTVRVAHDPEAAAAHLAAVGRGLVPALLLTVLAALLAARALVTARRLDDPP